jgi:hypothetical protein
VDLARVVTPTGKIGVVGFYCTSEPQAAASEAKKGNFTYGKFDQRKGGYTKIILKPGMEVHFRQYAYRIKKLIFTP